MKRIAALLMAATVAVLATPAQAKKCPVDSVQVGPICVDKYEASVWSIPDPAGTGKSVIKKIQKGKATLADLTDAGATQLGCTGAPFSHTAFPASFPITGNWTPVPSTDPPTPGVYAVSIPGVLPTACITWFQSEQACRLAGKRLLTNQESQAAAQSTPDPGAADDGSSTCDTNSAGPANTGARTNCVSVWGAHDMVGNVWEWVGTWGDRANAGCTDWTSQTGIAGADLSCFGGNGSGAFNQIPGALIRGGSWGNGADAGVFAVFAFNVPSNWSFSIGLRCGR